MRHARMRGVKFKFWSSFHTHTANAALLLSALENLSDFGEFYALNSMEVRGSS